MTAFSKYVYGKVAVGRARANVAAGSTDAEIAAAIPGKRIRVLSVAFLGGPTATTATFNSKPAGAGTAISPQFQNAANGGAVLPHNSLGWFQTEEGEGLSLTTGSGATTGVLLNYVEV